MTEHVLKMPTLADLDEAARLTRAGRLNEATALIRRGLGGGLPAATGTDPSAARPGPAEFGAHAALLPEGLRDALGQVVRGLRGAAPSPKGFGAAGPGQRPAAEPAPENDATGARFVQRSFSNAAGARDYKLFIPDERPGPRALVLMLHGCTQSPDDIAAGTRLNERAQAQGLYVAYPRQSRRANLQKCWNWFQPGDQGREHGEAGIIAGLTRAIVKEHGIDPSRVYVAGLSAGGAAAANLARAYPDLYAAVGVHSGLAAGCARDLGSAMLAMQAGAPGAVQASAEAGFGAGSAPAATRVPTIVFHGAVDDTVNPRNAEEVLVQAGIGELTASAETGQVPGGRRYTRTRYADAAGRIQVEAWRVEGLGHAWSGGSEAGSYTDPRGPDATRAMLDFFASHRLGEGPRA